MGNVETLRVKKQCPQVTMEMTEEATNGQTDGQTDGQTEKLACRECGTESRVRLLSCLHSYCADCIAHHAQDRESQLNYLENLDSFRLFRLLFQCAINKICSSISKQKHVIFKNTKFKKYVTFSFHS